MERQCGPYVAAVAPTKTQCRGISVEWQAVFCKDNAKNQNEERKRVFFVYVVFLLQMNNMCFLSAVVVANI